MASSPAVIEPGTSSLPGKSASPAPLLPVLAAVLCSSLLTVGGVSGVLLYLGKTGRIGGAGNAVVAARPEAVALKTHEIVLEPLLVNLSDPDAHSYLRAGITIQVQDVPEPDKKKAEPEKKDPKGAVETNAPLRDTVLEILGRQQVAALLGEDGKERLKVTLKQAFLTRNPELKVTEIYFTDFLVQR